MWNGAIDVLAAVTAWCVTFAVVIFCVSTCFSPLGVVGGMSIQIRKPSYNWKLMLLINSGSLAASFQSHAYGGFTPAGGVFATLTSMAMLGVLIIPTVLVAAPLATVVAVLVWKLQHWRGMQQTKDSNVLRFWFWYWFTLLFPFVCFSLMYCKPFLSYWVPWNVASRHGGLEE